MTGAYFDSGVLVKAYCREQNSDQALTLIMAEAPPLPFTHLQEAEVRNALRLKVFRQEMTTIALKGSLALLDEDIREGRLDRSFYDAAAVYRRAEILSARHAIAAGARMLDILHVATALEIEAIRFVSFDFRQRAVAKKAGFKILPRNSAV